MSNPTRYFAVIGRLCGDDENSILFLEAENETAASDAFKKWRWGRVENVSPEYIEEAEQNDAGVSVDIVLESNAPIEIIIYNH